MATNIRTGIMNVAVSATDNVAVAKVELYIVGGANTNQNLNVPRATTTQAPYKFVIDTRQIPDGIYSMFSRAYDTSGNVTQSNGVTIQIQNIDTTAPAVAIAFPSPGGVLQGIVSVSVAASDDKGVSRVDLYVDGVLKGTSSSGTSPYTIYLDTTAISEGTHSLVAKALDAANNTGVSSPVTVTVDNVADTSTGTTAPPVSTAVPYLRGVNRAGAEYGDYWTDINGWKANNGFYWQNDDSVKAECAYLIGKGMNCIRLPISWERIQHTLSGDLDTTYTGNLTRVVGLQNAAGIYTVIDLHGYARYATGAFSSTGAELTTFKQQIMGNGTLTFAHLSDVWVKICKLFQTGNNKIIFNLMNEPHDMSGYTTDTWFDGVNTVIVAIRKAGYNQLILAPNTRGSDIGHWTSATPGLSGTGTDAVSAKKLVDTANNLAIDCHSYRDSGTYDDGKGNKPGNWTGAADIIFQWARDNKRKLFFSEFGVSGTDATAKSDMQTWLQKMNDASDVVVGWTAWNLPSNLSGQLYTYDSPVSTVKFNDIGYQMDWFVPYTSTTVTATNPTTGTTTTTPTNSGGGGGTVTNSYPSSPASGYTTNKQQTFTASDGVTSYYIVPSSYNSNHNTPIGLLVWGHGCKGYSQYDVAYFSPSFSGFYNSSTLPASIPQTWITLGPGGREYPCWQGSTDYPKYTNAIATIRTMFNIDPKRIYIGGYSSGGDIGYPYAFKNSTLFAGGIFCNTAPFDQVSESDTGYTTAAYKFPIYHLTHTSDGTYTPAHTNTQLDELVSAGYNVTRFNLPGTHSDTLTNPNNGQADGDPSIKPASGSYSTKRDIFQYLLPNLNNPSWVKP